MAPLMIEIMLWYHTRVGDYGSLENNANAPAVVEAHKWLDEKGLLHRSMFADAKQRHTITEKGTAYVNALSRVGVPEVRWHVPMNEVA